jgi:hypothetical protein
VSSTLQCCLLHDIPTPLSDYANFLLMYSTKLPNKKLKRKSDEKIKRKDGLLPVEMIRREFNAAVMLCFGVTHKGARKKGYDWEILDHRIVRGGNSHESLT